VRSNAKRVRSGSTYLACTAGRATVVQTARVTRGGFAKEVRRPRRADSPVGKTGRSGAIHTRGLSGFPLLEYGAHVPRRFLSLLHMASYRFTKHNK
jgi:hypothetical protein